MVENVIFFYDFMFYVFGDCVKFVMMLEVGCEVLYLFENIEK